MLCGVIVRKEGRAGEVCSLLQTVTCQRGCPRPAVPATGGSNGKSEEAGSSPGSVAPWDPRGVRVPFWAPAAPRGAREWHQRELCKRAAVLRLGGIERGDSQKVWILGTLKSFRLPSS